MRNRRRRKFSQEGQTLVEFPLVLLLTFLPLVLGVMEFGRALYTWGTIVEATRWGTREAIVAGFEGGAYNSPTVGNIIDDINNRSLIQPKLTPANVAVDYLDKSYGSTTTYEDVRYVRVSIINYRFQSVVSVVSGFFGIPVSIPLPGFSTTLPRESLGAVPAGWL